MSGFFPGVVIGVVLGTIVTYTMCVQPVLDECQKNLPRTQQCSLTAVPEPVKDD